ncbi:MAG: hypothetical protein U1F11_12800 [Steroidobacteraceae bacterium]
MRAANQRAVSRWSAMPSARGQFAARREVRDHRDRGRLAAQVLDLAREQDRVATRGIELVLQRGKLVAQRDLLRQRPDRCGVLLQKLAQVPHRLSRASQGPRE